MELPPCQTVSKTKFCDGIMLVLIIEIKSCLSILVTFFKLHYTIVQNCPVGHCELNHKFES